MLWGLVISDQFCSSGDQERINVVERAELEGKYDARFKVVFNAIRQLMAPPAKVRLSIGFRVEEARPAYRRSRVRRPQRKQIIKA
ncbi:MAG: hypothetical protein A2Z31_00380 [candidate division NC10 bacterium RBG_16_65_8]|nr:MAG: hypothetical protein A2Z31_00380 [candidate division NC10 bacterium RBG_16_65_8]